MAYTPAAGGGGIPAFDERPVTQILKSNFFCLTGDGVDAQKVSITNAAGKLERFWNPDATDLHTKIIVDGIEIIDDVFKSVAGSDQYPSFEVGPDSKSSANHLIEPIYFSDSLQIVCDAPASNILVVHYEIKTVAQV